MNPVKQAATVSLAASMLLIVSGPGSADHSSRHGTAWSARDGWPAQQNWRSRHAPPTRQDVRRQGSGFQGWPGRQTGGTFFGWFEPQFDFGPGQNVEPEPEPAKPSVIYTYRADPLVALGDPGLPPGERPSSDQSLGGRDGGIIDGWVAGRLARNRVSAKVFDLLKDQTAGVRVTEDQRRAIVAFYRERKFAPVWVAADGVSPRARGVLAELADADAEGLKAQDYLPPEMSAFADDLAGLTGEVERLARLDLGLTAAAVRYAMHASGGRIVPNRISGYHDLNPPTVKPREAAERLATADDPAVYLASLHPVHPAYQAFRRELAKLRAATGDEDRRPVADGPTIRLGQADDRLPAIRERLASLGYLAGVSEEEAATVAEADAPLFGSDVEIVTVVQSPPVRSTGAGVLDLQTTEAVKAFQAAAGLAPDGIIGPRTIAALNGDSSGDRLRRLVYNMERLRWLPRDLGAKHVLVNQAAFELQVVENGATVWRTKVIVGKPDNQTAFFSDEMETVVFNPYWGVPGSIIVNEMLPELRRDPGYLDREGYQVTDLSGRVIPSSSVDWYRINTANLPIGVRQPPGPQNALGEIKFLFPNQHSIYMHDTPSKPLFSKPVRAFSHGCVRVENPRRFAELILGWDQSRIAAEIAGSYNQSVPLERKVPVHLAYFTAWPDEAGNIQYHGDIYGRDELLERAYGVLVLAMQ